MLNVEPTWNLTTSSTSSKHFKSLSRAIKSWCLFTSLVPEQRMKFIARVTALQWYLKIAIFKDTNKSVFFLLATWISFLLLNAKYHTQIVKRPKSKWHPHIAKAFSSPENIYKNIEHHGELVNYFKKKHSDKNIKLHVSFFQDLASRVVWLCQHARQ